MAEFICEHFPAKERVAEKMRITDRQQIIAMRFPFIFSPFTMNDGVGLIGYHVFLLSHHRMVAQFLKISLLTTGEIFLADGLVQQ